MMFSKEMSQIQHNSHGTLGSKILVPVIEIVYCFPEPISYLGQGF